MTSAVETFDAKRHDDFEELLIDTLNHGALALMLSVGHRTGLFDAMNGAGSLTAAELSAAAGRQERYVTEWLGAMVCSGVVELDPASDTYRLPPEHAGLVSRHGDGENFASFAQYIGLFGSVEDRIVECFSEGGGVAYSEFPRFHEVMEEESSQSVLPILREEILPLAEGLPRRLEEGIRVLDVGCGRGRALMAMAEWFPNSTFVGYDLSEEAIDHARRTARAAGLDNVSFVAADAARLDEIETEGATDLVTTFDAVHDQADPAAMVRAIRWCLAPEGVYIAQDIEAASSHHGNREHPMGTFLYTTSCMHCMTVSLARDGAGLGAMWGREQARELFTGAGFGSVEVRNLGDPMSVFYVCRP